jgi:translation elongation factor IF5A
MSDNEDFDQGDAGSADTNPIQAGSVKKNSYCMLKGFPCKVTEYSTAKPGKHGSAKATIVGTDIFTGKKYEDSCPTSHNMQTPIVNKDEFEVADVAADDFVSLIKKDGSLKEDLKLPTDEELRAELRKLWDENNEKSQVFFTVIRACGNEKIMSGRCKENNN